MSDQKADRPSSAAIQLGGKKLTGGAAWIALLAIVALIAGLVALLKPAFR